MDDFILRLTDELLLNVAFNLERTDKRNFALAHRRFTAFASEALVRARTIPHHSIRAYIAILGKHPD